MILSLICLTFFGVDTCLAKKMCNSPYVMHVHQTVYADIITQLKAMRDAYISRAFVGPKPTHMTKLREHTSHIRPYEYVTWPLHHVISTYCFLDICEGKLPGKSSLAVSLASQSNGNCQRSHCPVMHPHMTSL